MFKLFQKRNVWRPGLVLATQTGTAVSLDEVPDDIVKQRVLGDGIAIIPSQGEVYAPVDGVIIHVANTHHAYCIRTEDGLELLVHIGIDTVGLGGQGFRPKVRKGETVSAGQLLCKVDLELLRSKDIPTHTLVLSNERPVTPHHGHTKAGETLILEY